MMNLTLKQDLVWLDCITTPATSASIHLLGGDGQQIAVPVTLLLAASSLVKSILTGQLLPPCCPSIFSLPASTAGVLQVFVDILSTGAAACDEVDQIEEVKQVFEMLGVEADIVSYHPESIKLLDIKEENAAEEFNVGLNDEKIPQLGNIVKIEDAAFMDILDIKEESAAESEELDVSLNKVNSYHLANMVKTEDVECTESDVITDIEESKTFVCANQKKSSLKVKIPSASRIAKTRYHCKLCTKTFSAKSGLTSHTESVHCKFCPQKFSKKAHLLAHVRAVHDKISNFEQKFSWESALKVHVDSVHNRREYVCILCLQKFTNQSQLVSHLKTVHSKVLVSCSLCRKKFSSKSGLRTHFDSVHCD